jgi:hypothetical protein
MLNGMLKSCVFGTYRAPATNMGFAGRAQTPGLFVFEGEKGKLGSEHLKTQVPKGGTWGTAHKD